MYQVKILLAVASICCLITALVMLWNEDALSFTFFETKSLETVFVIAAVMLAKDYTGIKRDNYE